VAGPVRFLSTVIDVQGESIMKNNSVYLTVALAVCLAFMGVTFAQRPETNIDPARHANLAEAQHHILQAADKIDEAQKANREELGGHAEKAKQLLDQANRELKEAAEYADHHRK
jgi:F0F1-type ATP synthase membrane subunit b/b'